MFFNIDSFISLQYEFPKMIYISFTCLYINIGLELSFLNDI